MSDHVQENPAPQALAERVAELEQENARLRAELDQQRRPAAGTDRARLYRMLADNLPNACVFIVGRDMHYVVAAGRELERIGIRPESFEGRSVRQAGDPKLAAQLEPLFSKALAGETFVTEHRIRARDYITHGTPLRDEDGEVIGALALSYDMTETKQLSRTLLEGEQRFRRAFEHAAVGYTMTNADGHFVDANEAYCKLTGYTLEELRQRGLVDLIHPDDYEVNMRLIERQLANEIPPFVIENRYVRKDGGEVWVRKSVSWVLGADGKPQGLLAIVEDITKQRQTELERRASERIYRAVGETLPYGVWICDPAGRNVYASQSFLDLLGITQEQCSEFGWGDSLHPDDSERTIEAWKECVRVEGTWDIEHRFRGTDGKYHPILARGVPVRDERGEIICWAGINMDISRQKNTEEALRLSEERFQIALKNAPMLVYTTDRQLRYTWIFNPAWGVTEQSVIGKTDEEINPPEEVAELVALKQSVLDTGVGKRQELQLRHDGRQYWYDITVEPARDASGTITGLAVAAVDITENKRREKKALQSQLRIELQQRLLEQREQERLTLARDLHDGPIQTLAAMGMDLEMTRAAFDDPTLQMELSRIDRHIKDVSHELRDTVSELRPSQLHTVGLSQSIRAHADEFRNKHPEIELDVRVAPDQGRFSRYAALSLFRIYQEALNNVARHSGATRASVQLSLSRECATLEVRDNGRGMEATPDLLALAAEGHYGLAGMKERAEAVDGEFRLQAAPGKGTVLTITIPSGTEELKAE